MSLLPIVASLGGDIYANGTRASIPAPGHSARDRSASLMIGRSGRVIAYCFSDATPVEILDELYRRGLIDRYGFPSGHPAPEPAPRNLSDRAKIGRACHIWSDGHVVTGTLSARYLVEHRAVGPALLDSGPLRHHPACPVSVYADRIGQTRPALLCRIASPTEDLTALEITYLDANGKRDDRMRLSRKTMGVVPPGSFVRLHRESDRLLVAEGVMTTLSASEFFALPGHALLGVRNLRAYRPPPSVRSVTIAADRGAEGEAAAQDLFQSLAALGLQVDIRLPGEAYADFNHWAQALRAERRKAGEGRATGC